MQRVTITLDDDLLETLDSLSQRRGYNILFPEHNGIRFHQF